MAEGTALGSKGTAIILFPVIFVDYINSHVQLISLVSLIILSMIKSGHSPSQGLLNAMFNGSLINIFPFKYLSLHTYFDS